MLDPKQQRAVQILGGVYENGGEAVVKGPAGTGKSTVISELYKECPTVIVAAPTHKACDVLRKKGVTAQTIHSLMYEFRERRELRPMLGEDGKQLIDLVTNEPMMESVVIGQKWLPREVPVPGMVVFEEASMVGARMRGDIDRLVETRAFVGDPFQLPPVQDRDVFATSIADIELDHVWRIGESPPLAFATALRTGQPAYPHLFDIPVMARLTSTLEQVNENDGTVIVWRNVTRHWLNKKIREIRGAPGWEPVVGDKIVFYENDMDLGVYNGLGGVVDEVLDVNNFLVKLRIRTDAGEFRTMSCLVKPFKGEQFKRMGRRQENDPIHVEYAYAITCHKAQGSEFPCVYVVDDIQQMRGITGREEAIRWLYTAATRTTRDLTILR